jgi:hypothetical protein
MWIGMRIWIKPGKKVIDDKKKKRNEMDQR